MNSIHLKTPAELDLQHKAGQLLAQVFLMLDELVKHPDLLANTKLATFGDNRLLDFLPVRINALPQQFHLIAEKALALTMEAIEHHYKPGIHVVPRRLKIRAE